MAVEIGRKSFVLALLDVLHNSLRHRRLLHVLLASNWCKWRSLPPAKRNKNLLEPSRTDLDLPKQFQCSKVLCPCGQAR